MTTENPNIEITIDPNTQKTHGAVMFTQDQEPQMIITVGCIDAADQMEDLLNKFTCLPSEMKTLVWKYLTNFVYSHGYKIIETGSVESQ